MSQSGNTPKAPDYAKLYKQGIQTQIQYAPKIAQADLALRQQLDPQFLQHQQDLQAQYGPAQIQSQLDALKQMDPYLASVHDTLGAQILKQQQQGFVDPQQAAAYRQYGNIATQNAAQGALTPEQAQAYQALGQSTTGQLLRGTQADPTTLKQMSQAIRSRQGTLSGGNAPAMAEAVYTGQRGQQLLGQRQQASAGYLAQQNPALAAQQSLAQFYGMQAPQTQANAQTGTFMAQPLAQYANQIAGIQVPNASQYVNPNAGNTAASFGLNNYQNQLAQQQVGGNPWMGALSGAASGAAAGTTISPGYGTLIGAGIGAAGGYFSSEKLKKDISRAGQTTKDGIDIVDYTFIPNGKRYRGVIAESVWKVRPDAVGARDGFLTVNYAKLGIKLEEI